MAAGSGGMVAGWDRLAAGWDRLAAGWDRLAAGMVGMVVGQGEVNWRGLGMCHLMIVCFMFAGCCCPQGRKDFLPFYDIFCYK